MKAGFFLIAGVCLLTVSCLSGQNNVYAKVGYVDIRKVANAVSAEDPEWISAHDRGTAAAKEEIKKKIYSLVNKAVKNVAERRGYHLVFTLSEGVIYADTGTDCTEAVLTEAKALRASKDPLSR